MHERDDSSVSSGDLAFSIISWSVANGLPYRMFCDMVPLNKTGSCMTKPMYSRNHIGSNACKFIPSDNANNGNTGGTDLISYLEPHWFCMYGTWHIKTTQSTAATKRIKRVKRIKQVKRIKRVKRVKRIKSKTVKSGFGGTSHIHLHDDGISSNSLAIEMTSVPKTETQTKRKKTSTKRQTINSKSCYFFEN